MIVLNRRQSEESPLPAERRPLTPGCCGQRIAGNAAFSLLLLYMAWVVPNDGIKLTERLICGLYGMFYLGQGCYWLNLLRRIRRGDFAELVYPMAFRRRTKAATIFGKVAVIAVAFLISIFSIWALRTATRQGLALDLLLFALNVAAWWGVNHIFTRNDVIMKAPTVRIIPAIVSGPKRCVRNAFPFRP